MIARLRAWWAALGTSTTATTRPMTADEVAAFDAAFAKFDEAFDAMGDAFRKVGK